MRLRVWLTPSALPGISPTGGEIGKRHACHSIRGRQKDNQQNVLSLIHDIQDGQDIAPSLISPPVGEMPGRAEGGELAPASNMYRFTAG